MPYTPHPSQKRAIQRMAREAGAGLLLDPGLGKTSIALAAFKVLRRAGVVQRALVICPQRPARLTWRQESEKWEFGFTFGMAVGAGADLRRAALASDVDVYVINPENIAWLLEEVEAGRVKLQADMLIVDESTKFKDSSSVRFKALKKLLPHFSRSYILTGTPMPQSLGDMFAQSYICDGGAALGRYITAFRRDYMIPQFKPGVPVPTWHPQPDAEDRLFAKLDGKMLRLAAVDYLSMPAITYNRVDVELPDAARAVYRKVRDNYFARVDSGEITAVNAAAASMKLRQVANGTVYDTAGAASPIHSAKLDALKSLIEEQSGQPLLVAVAFVSEVVAIGQALGYTVPYLGGGVHPAESVRIVERWNRGEIPVLLAHPTSVAHGLNLQSGGHAVCWYGLTWNLEEYLQLNARVWRQGQNKPVVIHSLVARGTVDELMLLRLMDKAAAQERLFDALSRERTI